MSRRLLSEAEVVAVIEGHPSWERDGEGLRRVVEFDGFAEAFAFMTRVALIAERLDHHPEWTNAYGRVEIRISDHSLAGISTVDRDFVERVDDLI